MKAYFDRHPEEDVDMTPSSDKKKTALVLCTGNSCRSQMGEGLLNKYFGDQLVGYSAGTRPAGYVHPLAIEVMKELDVDLCQNPSKKPEELPIAQKDIDIIIVVCDSAAETCPRVRMPAGRKDNQKILHWLFDDPAKSTDIGEFRRVRDEIRTKFLNDLPAELA